MKRKYDTIKAMKQATSLVREAYKYVIPQLEKVCGNYFFHNPAHTINVLERATYLAMKEEITKQDLEDLQIASLFHDMGFLEQYKENEHIGAQMARNWLTAHNHDEIRIKKIDGMIMATILFSQPANILESIIQDADLDNIGTRESFISSQ